jgi:hypothetical protein
LVNAVHPHVSRLFPKNLSPLGASYDWIAQGATVASESNPLPARRRRWLRRLLIAAGACVALSFLAVLAVGWFVFSVRPVPEPEVVRRVSAERNAPAPAATPLRAVDRSDLSATSTIRDQLHAARRPRRPIGKDPRLPDGWNGAVDFILPRAEWGGWTLVRPEEYPVDPNLMLFPIREDFTPERQAALREFNRLFRECQAVIDTCRDPASGLTYRETDDLLHEVFRNQQGNLETFNTVANSVRLAEDLDLSESVLAQWSGLVGQIYDGWVENAVRHGEWMRAAHYSRSSRERLYFYRKTGGIEGYAALTGDIVEHSYRGIRQSHPFLERILP